MIEETTLLEIVPVNNLTKLQDTVESARVSKKNYVHAAYNMLSTEKFTLEDVCTFLEDYQWDNKLISVVFATKSVSVKYILTILKQKRFDQTLCVTALDAHCDNEPFIITLIANVYTTNPHRAKLLTKQFVKYVSEAGATCLCQHTKNDPDILAIMNTTFQKAA